MRFFYGIRNTLSIYRFFLKYSKTLDFFFSFLLFKEIIFSSNQSRKLNSQLSKVKYKSEYKFNHSDWFSKNIPIWNFIFDNENIFSKKIDYLEIGSFEGRSTVFMSENIKNIHVNVVDPFVGSGELKNINFRSVFKTFNKNITSFKNKIKINKTTSNIFFSKNKKKFNIIYVDGAHDRKSVESDAINAFKYLNKNGIIIFDDFLWSNCNKDLYNCPINALLPFLRKNRNRIEILHINYQLIVKKKY